MPELTLRCNLNDPDAVYADLLAAHEGLSKAESDALTARLLLILINHIGSRDVLNAALHAAGKTAHMAASDA